MPGIVSNSTPLIHLAKIGQLNLLHEFYGKILIPQAVYLALQLQSELLLLDDMEGRNKARLYELRYTGTIGVLLKAKLSNKLSSLRVVLNMLKETGFWLDKHLYQKLLKEVDE